MSGSGAFQSTPEQLAQWQRRQQQLDQFNSQFVKPVLHVLQFFMAGCFKSPVQLFLAVLVSIKFPKFLQQLNMEFAGSRFPTVFKLVALAQLARLSCRMWAFMEDIQYNLGQCAITSQVCATRANMQEWRSCLQMAAQWHRCSLQGAYQLWQSCRIGVPSPPVHQWMKLNLSLIHI